MGLQIVVKTPGSPDRNVVAGPGFEFQGLDQLEKIDPPIAWNPAVRSAFLCLADRVEVVGEKVTGAFTRIDDFVRLQVKGQRLTSTRYTVYEFSNWESR